MLDWERHVWPFLHLLISGDVNREKDIKMFSPNALLSWLEGTISFRFQDEKDYTARLPQKIPCKYLCLSASLRPYLLRFRSK